MSTRFNDVVALSFGFHGQRRECVTEFVHTECKLLATKLAGEHESRAYVNIISAIERIEQ